MSASTAPTTKVVHALSEYIPDLESQVLVQILIDEKDKIHVYPHQETPVHVFHKRPGANPVYPERVRWVVEGLRGRMLRIEAKNPGKAQLFPGSPFEIKGGENTIRTGPTADPGTWKYSINLFDMHNLDKPISTLDPTIEIIDEP